MPRDNVAPAASATFATPAMGGSAGRGSTSGGMCGPGGKSNSLEMYGFSFSPYDKGPILTYCSLPGGVTVLYTNESPGAWGV